MSFLDKPVSQLSEADLRRLIAHEVARQMPAIPAGVAGLADLDTPLVLPDNPTDAFTLVYNAAKGRYVDATNASPVATDGGTPGAPTVTLISGPGWIQAKWAAPTGTLDPLAYKVFIRAGSAPTTADSTYLVGITVANSLVINTLADGTTQIGPPSTVYHVKVVATSTLTGGVTGSASTDVTGSPSAVDGVTTTFSNIQAGTITAGNIAAARMTANFLTAAIATVTQLSAITADVGTLTAGLIQGVTVQTGSSGQRVVVDSSGAHLYQSDGTLLVDLPTDSSKTAAFTGTLTASALISLGATLSGTTQLSTGATLQMLSGVGQPLSPPAVSVVSGGSLSAATTYYIAFSWYDGTNETQISPVTSIATTSTLKTINITLPPAPSGATQARIYVNSGSTFATGAGHLQTTVNPVSSTLTTLSALASYNGAGAASPSSNTFPASSTSVIRPYGVKDTAGNPYSWSIEGNGRMRLYGPAINSQWKFYEEFLGGDRLPSMMVESVLGAGAGKSTVTSTNINPGVILLATGTTVTGSDDIAFASNSVATGVAKIRFSCYFKAPGNLPGGVNSYQIQLGLSDKNDASLFLSGGGSHFIAFTFIDAVTGGAFGLTVNDNGSGSFTRAKDAAGVNVSLTSSAYYFVEFEVNAAGTRVDWWVNSVPQAAVITNIPTAQMALRLGISKTAGTASRSISIDAVSLEGDFVS